MGNFTYLRNSDNEIVKQAAALSATATDTANVALGAANATVLPISLPWRSVGTGTKSLIVDFGTDVSVDFAAVCGHNISKDATEFRFFGGPSSPPAVDILNLLPNHLGPGTTWALRSAGAYTNRYWGVTINDASNADGFYEVGYLVLGVATELGFNFNVNWIEEALRSNRQAETAAGSPLVGELVDRRSRYLLTFGSMKKAERNTFKQFEAGFNGSRNPAFIVPDPDDNHGIFGRLETPATISYTHLNKGISDGATLSFIEDNPGIRINV